MVSNDPSFRTQGFDTPYPPSASGGGAARSWSTRDVLGVLFRRKKIILRFFVLVTMLACAASLYLEKHPSYPAQQKVSIVPPDNTSRLFVGDDGSSRDINVSRDRLYQDYLVLFQNQALYGEVADELELWKHERELWVRGRRFMKNRIRESISSLTERYLGLSVSQEPTEEELRGTAAWRLKSSIRVELERAARSLMIIRFDSPFQEPELNIRIIDAVLAKVEAEINQRTRQKQLVELAQQELDDRKVLLESATKRRKAFLDKYGLRHDRLEDVLAQWERDLEQREDERAQLANDIIVQDKEVSYAQERARLLAEKSTLVVAAPVLTPAEEKIAGMQRTLWEDELVLSFLELKRQNKETVNLEEFASLQSKVEFYRELIKKLRDALPPKTVEERRDYDLELQRLEQQRLISLKQGLEENLRELDNRIESSRNRLDALKKDCFREEDSGFQIVANYRKLEREFVEIEDTFNTLALKVDMEAQVNPFEKVVEPKVSSRPVSDLPMRLGVLIGGVLFGLVGGIAIAFMRDYFDNSVKSVDDVEEMLGIPVIASIPKNRKFKKLLK